MILARVKNEVGATAIEYGLIASLIGVLAVSGMSAVGVNLSNTYCTISKYLGGSGTCSGGTSNSADSGSAGTGVNSTNSIADGATLTQVEAGLTDELGSDFVDASLGGTGRITGSSFTYSSLYNSTISKNVGDALNNLNSTDPITNVFGIYDRTNSNSPLTNYDQVQDSFAKGGGNITFSNVSSPSPGSFEVSTSSGKIYTINPDTGSGIPIVTENTKK